LRKSFGKAAVDGLDLTVHAGELYALLGPNGAGKTTTLRMVAGLLPADAGQIEIFGIDARRDPVSAKRITAWLPDEPMLYDKLDPTEYLELVAGLWGIEPRIAERRAAELLELLGLADVAHERCEGFSRGMKQKVALAGALIHEPSLIMLDEPLTGLDAAAARQVKDLLGARVRAGATIIPAGSASAGRVAETARLPRNAARLRPLHSPQKRRPRRRGGNAAGPEGWLKLAGGRRLQPVMQGKADAEGGTGSQ
jgi:ABC-2 type transport system ATP-binding protein